MEFHEKVHAFIAAMYYVHLTDHFEERGKKAFIHATRYYASQRGRRMAQRAIHDGKELTYGTYIEYKEWEPSEEMKQQDCVNCSETVSVNPNYESHIFVCPWYKAFIELGLPEAGREYCRYLDTAICNGFNPELIYTVTSTLFDYAYCTHIVKDTYFKENEIHTQKKEYVKNFEYHCAHSYMAYRDVCIAIFQKEGEEIAEEVLQDIRKAYGNDTVEQILTYQDTDFNNCE